MRQVGPPSWEGFFLEYFKRLYPVPPHPGWLLFHFRYFLYKLKREAGMLRPVANVKLAVTARRIAQQRIPLVFLQHVFIHVFTKLQSRGSRIYPAVSFLLELQRQPAVSGCDYLAVAHDVHAISLQVLKYARIVRDYYHRSVWLANGTKRFRNFSKSIHVETGVKFVKHHHFWLKHRKLEYL